MERGVRAQLLAILTTTPRHASRFGAPEFAAKSAG
jgi:hypothetical protein